MTCYKLLRQRKDGSLGSLFINRRSSLPIGVWLRAESHPTKGYALRPGWHVCMQPKAPHLSMRGRIWKRVEVRRLICLLKRPKSQGGVWCLAGEMKILK